MVEIGRKNLLRVVREAPPGFYLDAGGLGEVLLPRRYATADIAPGGSIEVFLYRDSEDRLIATTETPRASVGDFTALKVTDVHPRAGAFLDWGLPKDLLLPLREQVRRVRRGDIVVVCVVLDERSGRIIASARLDRHLNRTPPNYAERQRVHLLIAAATPLGYRAIVENAHEGLLYKGELGSPLSIGDEVDGFVTAIRTDGKIDLRLDLSGYGRVAPLARKIIEALEAGRGRMTFGDHSSPAEIREKFGASKKAFKQAVGSLLRQNKIRITHDGIELSHAPRA